MAQLDHLKQFIETVRQAGLWQRLFGWRRIRDLLVHAASDLAANEVSSKEQEKRLLQSQSDLQWLKQENQTLAARKEDLTGEVNHWKKEFLMLQKETERLHILNTSLQAEEAARRSEHDRAMDSLTRIETRLREERARELEEKNEAALDKLRKQKDTWAAHELDVKNHLKSICQKHTVEYADAVPFRGIPDNALLICEEYLIFDAKSPAGEDLRNFPSYLKDQAEKAQKYTRQATVKNEIFFVVPSNTLSSLANFVYRFAEYTVYIISLEALEPVVTAQKKIEEYEFARELTPEDRNTICRLLGRFAHLSKRRIQVDSFFARQFIQLAYKAESDLPKEILDSVIEFERSEKLNPPQEKRNKAIPLPELEKDFLTVRQEADSRGIVMKEDEVSDKLDDLPLYKES